MKMSNLHHFTEHHRYYVRREFAVSGLEERVLLEMYQPMVGGFAVALYMTLCRHVAADRIGYSELEQQRRLFRTLDLEPNEQGRRFLADQFSKLEAVGLMSTYRRYLAATDEYVYGYELQPPLVPSEFFQNQHLTVLLRDKIGKYALLSVRDRFLAPMPEELAAADDANEDISVPFYELFRLNTKVIDLELEEALGQTAASRQPSAAEMPASRYRYGPDDILARFPRGSRNRPFVEYLRHRPDQLAAINHATHKYRLELGDLCRLLDEDGLFSDEGELEFDRLQYRASLIYQQARRREDDQERTRVKLAARTEGTEDGLSGEGDEVKPEKPVEMEFYLEVPAIFAGECDIHQYNMILRNEPYTLVLKRFFRKGSVPDHVEKLFERIDLNYKLNEEVINVLIHYLHTLKGASWSKTYVETIVTDLLAKGIDSYEKAVVYFRDQLARRSGAPAGTRSGAASRRRTGAAEAASGSSRKPKLKMFEENGPAPKLTEEERLRLRQIALERDARKRP